ncbi:MAG: tetratricopeptide repeat protein [Candidatus Hermodarchaeota archaeon]
MSHLYLDRLVKAEQLFDDGKLDEALEILNDWSQFEGLNSQQKEHFLFLKGLVLMYQNKTEELILMGEQIFTEGQKLNEKLQSFDGLYFVITGLTLAYRFDDALKQIGKAEDLLKLGSKIPRYMLIKRKARISELMGFIHLNLVNIPIAEKCVEKTLDFQKELGNTFEIVWANLIKAQIMLRIKSRYDLAIEYTKKAMALAKEIKFNHFWIALCHLYFGVIYSSIGELDISLKHSRKSLAIFREIKNNLYIAYMLNNIGLIYVEINNYDLALEYLEESLTYWELNPIQLEGCYEAIISVALLKEDDELAQKYFVRLEEIYDQKKDNQRELLYHYLQALILKKSPRIRDKAKAEEFLKKVVEKETLYYDVVIKALIQLCDLLLVEFHINNSSEVLDELNHYLAKLIFIAEKSHSYIVFCETFILQAKLALINFDIKAARRFLTQAQKIAEKYSIKRLAMKISYEHDEVLRQLKIWERLKESEAPISERMKLARLNEQMEKMVKKRRYDVFEATDEEPVLLLIVSEGGIPFFSQSFIKDKNFEDHLFGGFFTAINSFINEIFSEGLDRASFGDYTLLMNSIPPFLMCYIYKGPSYSAQNRIKSFINEIKSEKELWNKFEKFYQMNKKIRIEDIPSLETLIKDTFITKSTIVSEL